MEALGTEGHPNDMWDREGRRKMLSMAFERLRLAETGIDVKQSLAELAFFKQAEAVERMDRGEQVHAEDIRRLERGLAEVNNQLEAMTGANRVSQAPALSEATGSQPH